MDDIGIVLIIVLVVLIFISAFFSGSETSITAINQIKLDSAAENGEKSAKRVNSLRNKIDEVLGCLLYTSPSPRDRQKSRMPSSA